MIKVLVAGVEDIAKGAEIVGKARSAGEAEM